MSQDATVNTSGAPAPAAAAETLDRQALHAALAGLCASLVAIGLARFAYTPLIPALIQAHWFSASDAVMLGAANFAGYLAGALLGRPLAARMSNRHALRWLMVAATAAFFACAVPLSVGWFFFWRFLSGLAGGAIMVLVATAILPHIAPARRAFVSGLIFLGLGLGIAASGTLVPELLRLGLQATWIGLGVVSLVLTAASWPGWPASDTPPGMPAPSATGHHAADGALAAHRNALRVIYVQYAANALGLVPAMVLLVDYVARGLGQGASVGAGYWVLYGLAAISGPLVSSWLGARVGYRIGYRIAMVLQGLAVGLLAVSHHTAALWAATIVLGAFTPGIVPMVLGRLQDMMPHDPTAQRAAWSRATASFALFQALGGYGYAWLFSHTHENYALIFTCGAVAMAVAFAADFVVPRRG
ncbi:YbfB/YjiJ family MFS transporter [Cupriavidus agavae]|uniref:Putative MFS family arabinose efflux permease n=1 Tax=Cupriavidus agavae TaxID=1001822 RepID=A0A4Q7RFI3_9BURK|nr:YbfB/YjiJ family MFS transporter [Cupriavidus agavae]RZT30850.1 putative MFS family arabinose efflux permease [Cupriavidus agavae]